VPHAVRPAADPKFSACQSNDVILKMADDTNEMSAIIASSGFMIMSGAAVKLNFHKRKKRSM